MSVWKQLFFYFVIVFVESSVWQKRLVVLKLWIFQTMLYLEPMTNDASGENW